MVGLVFQGFQGSFCINDLSVQLALALGNDDPHVEPKAEVADDEGFVDEAEPHEFAVPNVHHHGRILTRRVPCIHYGSHGSISEK